MSRETDPRYFSCKHGHVVPRWGVRDSYIGSHRAPGGYVFHEDEIVAIPESEFRKYWREYQRSIKDGSLVKRTKKAYDESVKKIEAKVEAEAKERKAKKSKAKDSPKKKMSKTLPETDGDNESSES